MSSYGISIIAQVPETDFVHNHGELFCNAPYGYYLYQMNPDGTKILLESSNQSVDKKEIDYTLPTDSYLHLVPRMAPDA